jgi:hypothetical protein
MAATSSDDPPSHLFLRRGFFATLWAATIGLALKTTEQPVEAAANLQFQDTVATSILSNVASGPTVIYSDAPYATNSAVLNGLAYLGGLCGLAGGSSASFEGPSVTCGVHGYQSRPAEKSAGVIGDTVPSAGVGVIGRSGNNGLGGSVGVQGESGGGIAVRGLIPPQSGNSAIAVYGLNNSNFAGPGPGAGGFGVYGLSAKGHGLVGATATAGGAAVVGATNGVAGAYAAAFYGPVAVGGDLIVFGGKSAAVPHPDGSTRRVYCVESPECWFEDFGRGQLAGGCADISIEPGFAATVDLSDYSVFLTAYDRHQKLSVTRQTPTSFRVQASAADTGRFSYRIVARRKDIARPRLAIVPELPTLALDQYPAAPDSPRTVATPLEDVHA